MRTLHWYDGENHGVFDDEPNPTPERKSTDDGEKNKRSNQNARHGPRNTAAVTAYNSASAALHGTLFTEAAWPHNQRRYLRRPVDLLCRRPGNHQIHQHFQGGGNCSPFFLCLISVVLAFPRGFFLLKFACYFLSLSFKDGKEYTALSKYCVLGCVVTSNMARRLETLVLQKCALICS